VKAGPNGPASILTSAFDALALAKEKMVGEICRASEEMGIPELGWRLIFLLREIGDNPDSLVPKAVRTAKLAFLADKAGKTRVVYVLNWWVQDLLLPLHNAMMDWLKDQPEDGTFDQMYAVRRVMEWTKEGKPLWSFDLTAATDRWPMWHQLLVVRAFAGTRRSRVWWKMLTQFPPKSGNKLVCYAVGQPMGAYASWAALAMAHHLLLRYLAHRHRCPCEYVVLGDDVVIADKVLAEAYRNALTSLGVTISLGKSVTPEKSLVADSSAEFAKRLIRSGKDITPLPVELFYEVFILHQWWKVLDITVELSRRQDVDVRVHGDTIYVSTLVHSLIQLLPKKERDKVLALFGNIWTVTLPYRDKVDVAPGDGFHPYPNPWAGVDTLTFLHYWGEVLAESLLRESSKLKSLKDALAGDRRHICGGQGLELPSHPIWTVINRLDRALWSCYTTVTRGEQAPDTIKLMMDSEALRATLVRGKSYRDWIRSKDRKQKLVQTLTIKVLKRCK
jgi:hypothetical protein